MNQVKGLEQLLNWYIHMPVLPSGVYDKALESCHNWAHYVMWDVVGLGFQIGFALFFSF